MQIDLESNTPLSEQAYERLRTAWKLEEAAATMAIGWAIDVLADAIRNGPAPGARSALPRCVRLGRGLTG